MAGAPVSCENDPNSGIILSFMEQFGPVLDIGEWNIAELKAMLENSETVPQALADLHIKLMRKINKKVPAARWELALAKFAHSYSHQDAWEIERFGYKTANLAVKLRVLKALLEGQFDLNTKFKTQINTTGAGELRLDPLGRDREGNCYWYFMDESANVQIYQSDPEMEAWTLVARNRDEFANMINMLKENRPIEPLPAANPVEDEEDDSAGSASDAEGMKLGTILAPSETPPSLIISRRTYKTSDKVNASIVAEEQANTGEDSERPHAAAVEADDDVDMKTIEPSVPTEPRDAKGNDISVEKCDAAEQATKAVQPADDTAAVARPAESDVKDDDSVNDAAQCELDSKDEEMSTQVVDPTEGEKAEESTAIDKCINKEEPVTGEVEQSKSEPSAKDKEEGHVTGEAEREEKSGDDTETEEQKEDAKEPAANGTAQPSDSEKPVVGPSPQPSAQESLPVVACEENKQDIVDKPDTEPAAALSVGEAIEDPPVVVYGAGSGAECDSGIEPMFSEVIEEPMMFFYGAGAGVDNGMGNTKKVEPALATPESATANEAKLVGKKERVPSTDDAPVTSKAGNGERKSSPKGQPIKDGSSKSASRVSAVHSDGGEDETKHERNKSPEDAGCTDNGGGDHANTPSRRELSAKENDTVELGDRAADDGCDGGTEDREAEEVEPAQKKRTRKPPLEKSQKVVGVSRGKRSEKSSTETVAPVATAAVAEVAPEKPVEKKRGSRKSSTPKKALDSITATALLMHEEQLQIESEEKPLPSAGEKPAEDIKLGSVEKQPERNGDHLQQPQASCVEDNSNGVKKEEPVSVKEERVADCRKDSKSDVKKSTVEADPEVVKPGSPIVVAASKAISEEPTDAIAAATRPAVKEEKQEELEKQIQGGATDKGCPPQEEAESPAKRKRRQRNGLVDGLDISMVLDAGSDGGNNPPVRQSRRIAMQKIKEETNRRQIEDEMLKKMKADAVKKKKDLGMHISDDEYRRTESTPEQSDSSSSSDGGMGGDGRRRKKKKKKKKGSYQQQQLLQQQQLAAQLLKKQTTWNSATSPESSSETEAEDYFAEPYHSEEDVRRSNVLKSDHEFSPESDLESEAPAQPLKRARTARKARRTRDVEEEEEEEDEEEESDGGEDHACQECKKTDQPEWILLCDSCDKGYHCACLKPVLFTIPEGDWFCPVCQHRQLIERLQSKLELYDALQAKLEAEAKRREEEEQCAREAELAEQELEREREEQLRAQKRARQQQRLLERADSGRGRGGAGGNSRRSSRSRSASLDSSREEHQRQRRRRKQRGRNRKAAKRRRSSRSRSGGDGSGGSGASGGGSDDASSGGSGGSGDSGSGGSGSCTDSDDMPIYKHLRRRASTKVSYKFNEYDNLIDSAIRREMRDCEMMEVEPDAEECDVDDDEGHGFSKGKDISTIIEATTREEQARKKAAAAAAAVANEDGEGEIADRRLNGSSQERAENDGNDRTAPSPGGEEGKKSVGVRPDRTKTTTAATNKKARKKKKKLCKIELSSEEEEDDSDEDFRGDVSGSEDEEEEDDDDEDEDENSLSGDSESSLEVGRRGRNADRSRKPSSRAAVSRRRRIVENSDDSEDEEEERRREIAKKNRKNRRVLDDSDEELDLDDDDEEEDSEDYDSDDLCSDTETESSRSSANSSNSSSSSSSSSSASTEGDWRRKKKKNKKTKGAGGGGGKTKSKSTPSGGGGGGGLGSGKHIERPPKKAPSKGKGPHTSGEEESGDSDSAGKGGKTMPRKPSKKSASRSSRSPVSGKGEKKSDRKTRGKKIHYIVDDDFESSDDGIRPGVQRPDTPPEEREQFIRRQEEIKRMLAENNAAKAKELATSKIDQLVGGRAGPGSKESAKESLSAVPMQVIESARILDIDFLKSTSGNTARISTVDSVVDFDDELPEDFDPDDEMDDEALAKIMEEEDFAHHQLKPPGGVAPPIAAAADLLPPVPGPPPVKANRRKSIPDPGELLLPQQRAPRLAMDAPAAGQMRKDVQHHASPLPVNLASSAPLPPHVQSPMKAALLKPTGIPTSTIMPPMVSAGGGTILANALQTTAGPPTHGHHGPTVPPPPLVKEPPHPGASRADVLMRSLGGQPPPAGSLHHKPSDLSHLMAGLAGSGVPLPLAKGGGVPLSLPPLPPPHTHHSSHRLPPVGLGMPPGMPPGMMGHGPPPHAPHLGLHTKLPPGVPPGAGLGSNMPHSAAAVAAAVAAASAAAAAAIGAGGASGSAPGPVPVSGIPHTAPAAGSNPNPTPTLAVGTSPHPGGAASAAAERRPGRRKKITPLREDLKRRGNAAVGPPAGAEQQQPPVAAVPSAAHQEQHQRLPPQHASQHHGHMVRLPAGPPPPPTSTAAPPPVGLRPPIPPATSIHNAAHQNATAMAAAAAAAAAAQELAIKVHSRSADGGGAGVGGPGMHVNEPPLSVPSSVAHLSYLSENPLFAHRLGPLPSSILSSGSSSLQRIAAISGAAGPPTVYGDPTAYNGGWKPPPPGSNSKMKSSGSAQPPPPPPSTHPAGMMVGPPPIGSLEHYHEYNPANHYNPYYNVLDRGHLRPPPTIGELHRTSTLSPTTFTTLQPLEFQHVLKPAGDNHHHHHSATSSPASTAGEDVGGGGGGSGRRSAGSVERLVAPSHAGGPPPSSSSVPASSETHPSVVEAASPPPSASVAVSVAPSSLVPPAAIPVAASSTASTTSSSSTSVFGELVSYFSSQQDDLDS